MSNFQQIFESITMPWFYNHPLYFKLFCQQTLKENSTLHIPFRLGKNLIEYNSMILGKKSKDQLRKDLQLELTRIILNHPFRGPKDDFDFDKELWYKASTMTITQKGVSKLKLQKDMDIDYYYEMLRKLGQEETEDDDEDDGSSSGLGNDPDSDSKSFSDMGDDLEDTFNTSAANFFSDEEESKNSSGSGLGAEGEAATAAKVSEQPEDEEASAGNKTPDFSKEGSELWSCDDQESQKATERFMKNNSRNWGDLPSSIEKQLSLLMAKNSKIPSCVNLLEYFKGFRSNNDYALTRMRPSRRFGYQQMGKHHRAAPGKILIGIDVSESIKDVQVARFYHAVSNVFDRGIKHLEIFQFDTELKTKKPIPFRHRSQIKLVGKGGTNFQPIFDYIIKHQFEYDGLIIFSDGSGPAPVIHHKLRTKVLWVLYDEFCYNWYHEPLLESGLVTILQ